MNQKVNARPVRGNTGIGWDVVLFFALYVISPSYFAIEISQKLPLITMSRMLFVLMGILLLIRRRKELLCLHAPVLSQWNFGLTKDKILRTGLMAFFVLLVICDLALLPREKGEAVKALFSVVVEGYGLIWMLTQILDTREKLLKALKILVFSASVTAVITTIGCVAGFNPFYWLDTVNREMLMVNYYRLGLLRAEAGFGHPVYYGAFCAIIIPINMYFVEYNTSRREKLLYSACLSMNLVGLVLANSRGSLAAFACMVMLAAVIRIREKQFGRFILTYLPIGLAAVALLAGVALASPAGLAFLQGILNSMINTIAPGTVSTDIVVKNAETAEEVVISYGRNASGGRSRMTQLTGIFWTMQKSPLVGLGSNAHVRGEVFYQNKQGVWWAAQSFDIALVSIICQYGLMGLAGYAALYGAIFRTVAAKVYRRDRLMHFLGLAFVTFLLCLLTISSLDKMSWILFGVIVCLANIILQESQDSKLAAE